MKLATSILKKESSFIKINFCFCCCTQTTKREKETMYKMTINNCCPFSALENSMVYLTALKLQAPAYYYLKRRRAIIGNLNRLFKQKEKNFYIQKYNVILFVGGDFYWPCKKLLLMAAKLSMSFTWPLYFSKAQVNSNKMWHKFHYLNSGLTHVYYF